MITQEAINVSCNVILVLLVGSTVLILLTCLITRILNRSSAAVRFSVWQSMFCGLLLLPLVVLWMPIFPVLPTLPSGLRSTLVVEQEPTETRPSQLPVTDSRLFDESSEFSVGSTKNLQDVSRNIGDNGTADVVSSDEIASTQNSRPPSELAKRATAGGSTVAPTNIETGFVSVRSIVLLIWLLGAIAILIRMVISFCRVRSIVRSAIEVERKEIETRTGLTVENFPRLQFALSNQIDCPVTTGVLTPTILLTSDSLELDSDQLRMVVLHELAHMKRRDLLWQFLFSTATSLYWIQPLAWFANGKVKQEREQACDDSVLASGAPPKTYASLLLAHVAKGPGSRIQRHGALAMASPPLEYRLKAILDQTICRQSIGSKHRLLLSCLFAILVVGVGTLRPFDSRESFGVQLEQQDKPNQDSQAKKVQDLVESKPLLPETLSGKITDEKGKPLQGVKVEVSYKTYSEDKSMLFSLPTTHKNWSLTTDENGIYSIDTKGLDTSHIQMDKRQTNFFVWASIDKHLECPIHTSGKYACEERKIRTIKLPRGRKISGRVVSETSGGEVINPRVRVVGPDFRFSSRIIQCDNDGNFSLYVPTVGQVEILAYSDNLAATRVFAGKEESLGEIPLKPGFRVKGVVLDESNLPVSGVVVSIRNNIFNNISQLNRNGKLTPSTSVKTEMDGKFEFPPFLGPCTVSVGASGWSQNGESNFIDVFADQKPPIIMPIGVDLDGSKEEVEITLRAAPVVTVSGSIRWPDRSPAGGVKVQGVVMSGGQGVELDQTISDVTGKYQLRFPLNAESSLVSCYGASDENSVWHYAEPRNDLDANQKTMQTLGLKKLTTDLVGADWLLVAKAESKAPARKVTARQRESKNALSEISARYYRTAAADRDIPGLISELTKLEEKYRGETAALNALAKAMTFSQNATSKDSAAVHALAVDTLKQHYLAHPHLDCVMSSLSEQTQLEQSLSFLELVESKNPSSQVKASAMLYRITFLVQKLETRELLESQNWTIDRRRDDSQASLLVLDRVIAEAKAVDPEKTRQQIEEIARRLKSEYGQQKQQQFLSYIQSFQLSRYTPDDMKSFGELVDPILFRVAKLRPGKTVPDFSGKDVLGKEFKLSDFRGKVVMLMFSADWCQPCKEMYPDNRKKVDAFEGRPFQMISVMGDRKPDTVDKAVDAGEITWLTTWDGDGGPIASKWNVSSWPTVFIIDHEGVIHSTSASDETREAMIEKLVALAEAAKDKSTDDDSK